MSHSDCAIVSYVTTMDFRLSKMSVMILLQQIQHVIARTNPNLSNHAHIITIPIMVIIRFMFIIVITTSRGSSSGGAFQNLPSITTSPSVNPLLYLHQFALDLSNLG